MDIRHILDEAVNRGASDIHISVDRPVTLRIDGKLVALDNKVLIPKDTEELTKAIASEQHQSQIERIGGVDFGFNVEKGFRFRASCFKQKGAYGIVLRLLPRQFYTFEQIGLPDKVVTLLNRPRGLILVTGPTGSGKTTTLASMINYINETREDTHIITIEDPIEYFHDHQKAIVTQREVGVDVPS
ncbi:MAG: Flp pilus assembly complex ATPase component TadA, partial [Candidatus Omnitrophica bacterium]|nr:Flp pilus assembly complex ATPase component TadA [Candidatus Omnitrophota bacterium]